MTNTYKLTILVLIAISSLFSETITGRVIDETGKSIRGVTISYDNIGTITDRDGVFILDLDTGVTITAQHIGYQTHSVESTLEFMEITLISTPIRAKGVLVTSGFQDLPLKDTPSSVRVIDRSEIADKEGDHFQAYINSIANLNWAGGTSRPRYFQIRGIGERSLLTGEGPPNFSVGFTIDDIDFSWITNKKSVLICLSLFMIFVIFVIETEQQIIIIQQTVFCCQR